MEPFENKFSPSQRCIIADFIHDRKQVESRQKAWSGRTAKDGLHCLENALRREKQERGEEDEIFAGRTP
jgi:hypothetical protein